MFIAALAKIMMTFLKNFVIQLALGSSASIAAVASFSTLYITVINALAAIIIVTLLYRPVSHLTKKMLYK